MTILIKKMIMAIYSYSILFIGIMYIFSFILFKSIRDIFKKKKKLHPLIIEYNKLINNFNTKRANVFINKIEKNSNPIITEEKLSYLYWLMAIDATNEALRIDYLKKKIDLFPNGQDFYLLARSLQFTENYEEAINYFYKAIKAGDLPSRSMYSLAECYSALNNHNKIIEISLELIKDYKDIALYEKLYHSYKILGKNDDALLYRNKINRLLEKQV